MSTLLQTTTPAVGGLKQRARPGLKLNVTQKAFEDDNILVNRNSEASFVVQNHPRNTDQSEFSYTTQKKYGQIFFTNSSMSDITEDHSYMGTSYYVIQKANGKEQQDRYKAKSPTLQDDLSFFGVYDGHTTHLIAELLAKKLDEDIIENFKNTIDMNTAIALALRNMEKEVMSGLEINRPRGGSTALCTIIHDKKIYTGNLGDSQAVVFQDESFHALNDLHDFSNENERKTVEQRGGTLFNNRLEGELALSRSIGDINFKTYMSDEPEVSSYQIKKEDKYLLLGSDGFWNGLNPQQCLVKIQEYQKDCTAPCLRALGDFLIDAAKSNIIKKKDNMTLIVVDLASHFNKKIETKPSKFF